jgi:hypothetical protein
VVVPSGQVVQVVAPADAENVPTAQSWQALAPLFDWALPAGHGVQVLAPADE